MLLHLSNILLNIAGQQTFPEALSSLNPSEIIVPKVYLDDTKELPTLRGGVSLEK